MRMDDVLDEPVFQASRAPSASDEAGVWGEPALSEVEAADAARTERRVWLREQWESTGTDPRLGVFVALCALSGLWAILCTFMKGAFEMSSAVPWMVAAMIVHGLYNAAALVYGILT